jgi:L-histidine N-alpha-methyltransferase
MSYDTVTTTQLGFHQARAPSRGGDSKRADGTLDEIVDGLSQPQKRLPTRLLYDEQGSRWFETISGLPEYYVTRAELGILEKHAKEIAGFIGRDAALIEPGAGCGAKARLLLAAMQRPRLYAPMDIDDSVLRRCSASMRKAFPKLQVTTLHADFQQPFLVPQEALAARRVIFFPGSTIGNFEPAAAQRLLRRFHGAAGRGGRLLIGIDLRKNARTLRAAYDDAAGVTARFNLNLLSHVNREYGGHFDLESFAHRVEYDKTRHRIEMHLVSLRPQLVRVGRQCFRFERGETIHTENSYKYLPADFATLAGDAGWLWTRMWLDPQRRFGVLGFHAMA